MDHWWEDYNEIYTLRDESPGGYKGETPLCHWVVLVRHFSDTLKLVKAPLIQSLLKFIKLL